MNKFMTLFVVWMIIHFNSVNAQDQTENPDEMEEEGIVFIAFLFVLKGSCT